MKKLGVTTLVAIVAVLSRYFVWANLTNQTSENDAIRPNFPETNAIQTSNALAIMDQVRREGLGTQGCLVGLVAGLAEVVHPRHRLADEYPADKIIRQVC